MSIMLTEISNAFKPGTCKSDIGCKKHKKVYICLKFEICECVHVPLTETGAGWMFLYTDCKPVLPDICDTNRKLLRNQAAPAPAQFANASGNRGSSCN